MGKKASNDARAGACADGDSKKQQKTARKWTQLERYKRLIKDRMTALGIYKPQYGALIERTAKLYVKLDELEDGYKKSGMERFVPYTNKAGATNLAPNPYISAIEDVYAELIVHERELGLTPAAMRKLGEASAAAPKKSPLEAAIEKLTGG